jgi:hypothetical protein
MESAAIGTVFVQESADAARSQWRSVANQLRGKFPKLGALMDEAEIDALAFMTFPRAHWSQIYSTNPLERLNAEIKRRTNVVGIFPNDPSITRLVGAMMLEQNDKWSLNRRYMQLEGLQTLRCYAGPAPSSARRVELQKGFPASFRQGVRNVYDHDSPARHGYGDAWRLVRELRAR